jgi:hypothetical protein
MKLPNGELAVVDDAKLMDYCLSPTHPRGRHKARLFAAALGITQAHLNELKASLLATAKDFDCTLTKTNQFGKVYEITFECTGPVRSAEVLSVWIILDTELFPRLVTCYPV